MVSNNGMVGPDDEQFLIIFNNVLMVFTEWEKHLPFIEYEVIIGRAVLHSDLLGSRLKAISQE